MDVHIVRGHSLGLSLRGVDRIQLWYAVEGKHEKEGGCTLKIGVNHSGFLENRVFRNLRINGLT